MKFLVGILCGIMTLSFSSAKANYHTDENSLKSKQLSSLITNASIYNEQVKTLFDSLSSGTIDDLHLDDYYEGVYFSNLRENFGNNRYGSCSYVAIGMLLSFYDSYWSDSFVPEQYDVEPTSAFTTYASADFSFPSFYAESPGIASEPSSDVDLLSIEDYLSYVSSNSNNYFQSKLITLSQSYFGSEKFESEANQFGMTFAELTGFLNYYLYDCQSFTTSQVTVDSCNDQTVIRTYIKNKIKNGTPVIVRAQSQTLGGHAFIAYDYDESSDEIYVHTGWRDQNSGKTLTHVSLSSTGFTSISDAISLNVFMPSSFSFNYHSTSGGDGSARNFVFPQDIKIVSGNYRDELPTYTWKSIYKEKWIEQYNPYFDLSILDSSSNQVFKVEEIMAKQKTLSQSQWDTVLDDDAKTYYAYIELDSDTYPYWDDYYAKRPFAKPLDYNQIPQIKPNEYGFADAYPTSDSVRNDFISHTASHDFAFETRRFRTGYIHNEYVVMSPTRKGFKEAFIEYRFSYALTRIDVELAHWRTSSYEWLTSSTGEAAVQYYWENQWVDKLDLLASSTDLPTDRNAHKFYKMEFENPVYRVRFHAETFAENSNESNRGRICIGNMAFYPSQYNLPLSGGELDYEPSNWNNSDVGNYNCYAYALDTKNHGFMQPGGSEGHTFRNTADYLSVDVLRQMVSIDANNYDFTFTATSKNTTCPENYYKVALVIAPNQDYHWYRQNSDGTWSHKPGQTAVTKYDRSGNLIYDPESCDRTTGSPSYSVFAGFYQVNIQGMA